MAGRQCFQCGAWHDGDSCHQCGGMTVQEAYSEVQRLKKVIRETREALDGLLEGEGTETLPELAESVAIYAKALKSEVYSANDRIQEAIKTLERP